MGGTESQGISKGGPILSARLVDFQIWHLIVGFVALGGGLKKMGNGLDLPFCLRECCPLAPVLMPDTPVSPYMPLVPFKLLPLCWSSEGVSLSKSVHGFFKGNCLKIQQFLLLTQCPLVFAARSYEDLYPGIGILVWGACVWRGPLASVISPLNFYLPYVDVGPACSTSLPLLPVWMDVISLIL